MEIVHNISNKISDVLGCMDINPSLSRIDSKHFNAPNTMDVKDLSKNF